MTREDRDLKNFPGKFENVPSQRKIHTHGGSMLDFIGQTH